MQVWLIFFVIFPVRIFSFYAQRLFTLRLVFIFSFLFVVIVLVLTFAVFRRNREDCIDHFSMLLSIFFSPTVVTWFQLPVEFVSTSRHCYFSNNFSCIRNHSHIFYHCARHWCQPMLSCVKNMRERPMKSRCRIGILLGRRRPRRRRGGRAKNQNIVGGAVRMYSRQYTAAALEQQTD